MLLSGFVLITTVHFFKKVFIQKQMSVQVYRYKSKSYRNLL